AAGPEKPDWNQRPRDVANLTRWVGDQVEGSLKWHVVSLAAPVAELHDAPILYLAGSRPVALSDDEVAKVRRFIEEGGMVVANADCGSRGFASSVEKLAGKMFPYEFRDLPADHPLYVNQQFRR